MTDSFHATPIPAALERDALTAGVIDSSPLGGVLTDGGFHVLHASTVATRLLGLEAVAGPLNTLVRRSRLIRPDLFERLLENLSSEETVPRSYHVVESESGEARCIAIDAAPCMRSERRWLFWLQDVTAESHLQQFQLLAEIGRSRGVETSTSGLAERLVDALVRILGVDTAVIALGDENALRPVATRGMLLEDGFVLVPRDRAYLAKALESLQPTVSDGSEWDSAEQEMTGSHYIVPLVASGRVVGTLHITLLDDRQAAPFMGFSQILDMAFLQALSAYAGAAIANTGLFEEVREERLKLKTVVDFIPEGIILYTGRGDVLAVNESAIEITERSWLNMNTDSRPYRLLNLAGEPLRRVDWPFFRCNRDEGPILGEEVILDFGTRRKVLSVNVVPVPSVNNDSVPTYVGTMRDITLERERQAEREGFLQIVSHEMRSPLTPLTGFLQMVRKQIESGESVDSELVHRAEQQVGRLARLIDRVLDLSRIERSLTLTTETVDLREIAQAAGALWQADPRGISVELRLDKRPALIDGDVDRVHQILTNLVDNAVKHSPVNAVVEIEVVRTPENVILRVHDAGSGIPADQIERVFERFFSGSDTRGGMGIGLYITRQLVVAHHGTIRVTSQPNVRTTFEVTLPSASH